MHVQQVCDFLGTAGTTIGLELAGSAIFGIIFSSVTVWTALFTCAILKKAQSAVKMLGIATVVIGLTLPTLDKNGDDSTQGRLVFLGIMCVAALGWTCARQHGRRLPPPIAAADAAAAADSNTQPLRVPAAACRLTFTGTLFYALEYTLCEQVFSLYERPVDSKELCFFTGGWGLLMTLMWMCVYTTPRWQEVVVGEIAEHDGSLPLILFLFLTHTINNGVHNYAWFVVCELESGVSTGLLMGVKAATLFLASAICFCDEAHTEQCMTPAKASATAIVLVGTGVYYYPGDLTFEHCFPRKTAAEGTRSTSGGGGGGNGNGSSNCSSNGGGGGDVATPSDLESGVRRPKGRRRKKGKGQRFGRIDSGRRLSGEDLQEELQEAAEENGDEEEGRAEDEERGDEEREAAEEGKHEEAAEQQQQQQQVRLSPSASAGHCEACGMPLAQDANLCSACGACVLLKGGAARGAFSTDGTHLQGQQQQQGLADARSNGGGGSAASLGGGVGGDAHSTPGSKERCVSLCAGGGGESASGPQEVKCNGTPAPLASPIDEDCCRTPLEPTSSLSSAMSRLSSGAVASLPPLSPLSTSPPTRTTPRTAASRARVPATPASPASDALLRARTSPLVQPAAVVSNAPGGIGGVERMSLD